MVDNRSAKVNNNEAQIIIVEAFISTVSISFMQYMEKWEDMMILGVNCSVDSKNIKDLKHNLRVKSHYWAVEHCIKFIINIENF